MSTSDFKPVADVTGRYNKAVQRTPYTLGRHWLVEHYFFYWLSWLVHSKN